ncbi:WbqC family protein [Pectobacterium versatile]|uniref:WbqC family protein n=1 Tax=Pectobacterium versatile TaxID=2488639 RepID=UPI000F8DE354|nr:MULTISPECIES: WbqC family protein [Pectobacterium]MBA0183342.1 WbqC family protein [Pectobacterium versatile]MCA5931088.1 WbqC family protein [Pectobacterium versatile]MCA5948284.1 WbqC family protein [Pectobacterium versatile]MCA5952383.1 WbqC family protein [Pectobacterium versatile]MCL6375019.1 hypothetical protein [Pectobacterium atrosepticum]
MKLGIMQPYFFPYIGYWQLIKAVDVYVIYDDVNYIKGGWINRNNFLINGGKKLFSISLDNSSSYKLINEIEIKDDFVKFVKMIKTNYSKAPFFNDVYNLVNEIIAFEAKNLAMFLFNSIELILKYLSIKRELLLSSDIQKDVSLKGQDKILNICGNLCADSYINAIGGEALYEREVFHKNGIGLFFIKPTLSQYKQNTNVYVPGLSIIDVMMFNSPDEINKMLDDYEYL